MKGGVLDTRAPARGACAGRTRGRTGVRRPGLLREASRQSTRAPRVWSGTTGASPSAESPPPSRRVRRGSPGSPPVAVVKIGQNQGRNERASGPRQKRTRLVRLAGALRRAGRSPWPCAPAPPGCSWARVPRRRPPLPVRPAARRPRRPRRLRPRPWSHSRPRPRPPAHRRSRSRRPPRAAASRAPRARVSPRARAVEGSSRRGPASVYEARTKRRHGAAETRGRGGGGEHPVRELPSPDLLGPRALLLPPRLVPRRARARRSARH